MPLIAALGRRPAWSVLLVPGQPVLERERPCFKEKRSTSSDVKRLNKEKNLVGQKVMRTCLDRGEGVTLGTECFSAPADRLRRMGSEEDVGMFGALGRYPVQETGEALVKEEKQ